jgi:hypothetical protein
LAQIPTGQSISTGYNDSLYTATDGTVFLQNKDANEVYVIDSLGNVTVENFSGNNRIIGVDSNNDLYYFQNNETDLDLYRVVFSGTDQKIVDNLAVAQQDERVYPRVFNAYVTENDKIIADYYYGTLLDNPGSTFGAYAYEVKVVDSITANVTTLVPRTKYLFEDTGIDFLELPSADILAIEDDRQEVIVYDGSTLNKKYSYKTPLDLTTNEVHLIDSAGNVYITRKDDTQGYITRITPDGYQSDISNFAADFFGYRVEETSQGDLVSFNSGYLDLDRLDLNATTSYTLPTVQTSFYDNGGLTKAPVATAEFGGTLYQAITGYTTNNIYLRSTTDGTFDNSVATEDWTQINGETPEEISLATFNDGTGEKLYMTVKGNSGAIFTRSTSDGTTWTEWNENGGATSTAVATEEFGGRMYQSIRGVTTTNIYVRSSADGVFDGVDSTNSDAVDDLENWTEVDGNTPNAIALEEFNGALYMSVRGNSGEIFNRATTDGSTWTAWDQNGGATSTAISMSEHEGKLYQSIKGNSTNDIYVRTSSDGTNWTGWLRFDGATPMRPNLESFSGTNTLFQTVIGNSGNIFLRELD